MSTTNVIYDDVDDLLSDGFEGGRKLDDILTGLDTAAVEVLDEPKPEVETKAEESEELDLDIASEFNDKTNDPVRMYLREMGTVALLTREGEIELARRIERGQSAAAKAMSRSPLVIRDIIALADRLREDPLCVRDLVASSDLSASDEQLADQSVTLISQISSIEQEYQKAQQSRQKLLAVGIEPTISKSPEEFAAFIKSQAEVREKVIKAVGMKLD